MDFLKLFALKQVTTSNRDNIGQIIKFLFRTQLFYGILRKRKYRRVKKVRIQNKQLP